MKVAGYDYLTEQNNRIYSQLQNFNTGARQTKPVESVNNDVSSSDDQPDKSEHPSQPGVSLNISSDGSKAENLSQRPSQTSSVYAATDFSTGSQQDNTGMVSGNSVLNQYRFFVQSSMYEGNDGVVKRIFR